MNILQSFIRRALQAFAVLIAASFITFGLTYLSPSDPAEMMLTSNDMIPTEELLEKTREEMGLKDPFIVQYGRWLHETAKGDLGYSYSTRTEVRDVIGPRVAMTVRLAMAAVGMLVMVSVLLGIIAAIWKDHLIDKVIRGISLIGISIPGFWMGMMLIFIFVVKYKFFKITDPHAPTSVILPAVTLAIPLSGRYIRQIRASVLEQFSEHYVIGARARGLKERDIIAKEVLPNAMLSIITLLGLSVAMLLGGTVIVERIFAWPGLGTMAIDAITYRDYPLLQAYVIFMTIIYVGVNFLVDVVSELIDPRLRLGGGREQSES